MQTLPLKDLYHGVLGEMQVVERKLSKRTALNYYEGFKEREVSLRKLIAIVMGGDEFYARITDGCRAGSIVRIDGSQYDVKAPGKSYNGRDMDMTSLGGMIIAKLVDVYGKGPHIRFETNKMVSPNIPYQDRVKARYDGRKDVQLSHNEQFSLEFLPNYQGPTVFEFNKTKRTEEERAAMRDPAQHQVFDQIGEEIALGDLFFYGSANSLTICKLTKVGKTGSLAYKAFVGGAVGRIINEVVRDAVSKGKPVPCLLKFTKDLSDKLMIYKLAKM